MAAMRDGPKNARRTQLELVHLTLLLVDIGLRLTGLIVIGIHI
jgi:hypothetical protein